MENPYIVELLYYLDGLEKGYIHIVNFKTCFRNFINQANLNPDAKGKLSAIYTEFDKNNELNKHELKKILREINGTATIDKNETDEINEYLNEGWTLTDKQNISQYIMHKVTNNGACWLDPNNLDLPH